MWGGCRLVNTVAAETDGWVVRLDGPARPRSLPLLPWEVAGAHAAWACVPCAGWRRVVGTLGTREGRACSTRSHWEVAPFPNSWNLWLLGLSGHRWGISQENQPETPSSAVSPPALGRTPCRTEFPRQTGRSGGGSRSGGRGEGHPCLPARREEVTVHRRECRERWGRGGGRGPPNGRRARCRLEGSLPPRVRVWIRPASPGDPRGLALRPPGGDWCQPALPQRGHGTVAQPRPNHRPQAPPHPARGWGPLSAPVGMHPLPLRVHTPQPPPRSPQRRVPTGCGQEHPFSQGPPWH